MKPGEEYELLIANLYRSLAPNAEVRHNDHIYDNPAKIKRQIDVSIKSKLAGVEILIIIQVKDHKIPANVSVVDQFKTVIEDTKASKGILICSKGFSQAALDKAKSHKIECLTVHSALKKEWEKILQIPVLKTVHYFNSNHDIRMLLKAGETMKGEYLPHTYSYDGLNIISFTDIISQEIFAKMSWRYITEQKKITIDLKKLGLNAYVHNVMLPIVSGHISIEYLKSERLSFYIKPVGYILSTDHINSKEELHNLTIDENLLLEIYSSEDHIKEELSDSPKIIMTIFNFNNGEHISYELQTFVDTEITGDFVTKGNSLMKYDERAQEIMDIEKKLKGT